LDERATGGSQVEEIPVMTEELEVFEALSCLRWLLLDRMDGVPKNADTIKRVRRIVKDNRFMNERVLL